MSESGEDCEDYYGLCEDNDNEVAALMQVLRSFYSL